MRLLYKLILADPDFLHRLKQWCAKRNIDRKRMWYFIKLLRDHKSDDIPVINFLRKNNLITNETYELLVREVSDIEAERPSKEIPN